jgi:hypothetical protein
MPAFREFRWPFPSRRRRVNGSLMALLRHGDSLRAAGVLFW